MEDWKRGLEKDVREVKVRGRTKGAAGVGRVSGGSCVSRIDLVFVPDEEWGIVGRTGSAVAPDEYVVRVRE